MIKGRGGAQYCRRRLALGRLCHDIRPGLHRHEHGKDVLFYGQERGGILISRILHQRMLPDRHTLDNQDDES
jgi:plasmid stabilization system protein ParE